MNNEAIILALENKINSLIEAEPAIFLVEIRIKPTNNIKIFLDGDNGISIDRLIQINRKLYRDLEENPMFPGGDFSLEVSSPGLDEPLKLHRQYQKNIGRFVEVLNDEGVRIEGKLIGAAETEISVEVETGKGKKKEVTQVVIPMDKIKSTFVQVKF
jgi:ribosome maturation factor RimP